LTISVPITDSKSTYLNTSGSVEFGLNSATSPSFISFQSPINPSNLLFGTNCFCVIILSPPVVPSLLPFLSLVCHFLLPMWLMFQNNALVVVQGSLSLLLKDFQVND